MNDRLRRVSVILVLLGLCAGTTLAQATFPEPTVPEAWQGKTSGELLALAGTLSAEGEAKAAERALLAQYVGFRLLNDPAAARAVVLTDWGLFSARLATDMTADQKSKWQAGVRRAFAPTQAATCALGNEDFTALTGVLRRVGDESIAGLWAWRVGGKYLTDAATIKAVGIAQWRRYVASSKAGLSEADCQQWRAKLQAAFIPTASAMAAMADEEFTPLTYLLRSLAATDIKVLTITRMTARDMTGAASVRAVGLEELKSRSGAYSRSMTDAMRAMWRTTVREAFAANDAMIGALSDEDFGRLLAILYGVKDDRTTEVRIARLSGKYLGNVAAIRSRSLAEWRGDINRLHDDMPEEVRVQLAAGLRAAYADAATLSTMSDRDFNRLYYALIGLEDTHTAEVRLLRVNAAYAKDAATVAAQGVKAWRGHVGSLKEVMPEATKAQWVSMLRGAFAKDAAAVRALSDEDFGHLTNTLVGLGDPDLKSLAITRKTLADMSDVAAIRSRSLAEWRGDINRLHDGMSEEVKVQWRTGVRQAYAGDAATVAALSDEDFGRLIAILNVLKDEHIAETRLLRVSAAYAKDAATVAAQGVKAWRGHVGSLKEVMPEAAKAQWVSMLRGAFAKDAAAVRALSDEDFGHLTNTLVGLGDPDLKSLAITRKTFADMSDVAAIRSRSLAEWRGDINRLHDGMSEEVKAQWRTGVRQAYAGDAATVAALSDEDFGHLIAMLRTLKDATTAALDLQRIASKHMASAEAVRSRGLDAWDSDILRLGKVLSDEDRSQWIAALRGAYVPDDATVAALDGETFQKVMTVLQRLQDPNRAALSAVRIKALAMSNVEAIRAAGLETWVQRTRACKEALSDEDRQQWIAKLREAFAPDDAALAALDDERFALLMTVLRNLDDPEARRLIPQRLGALHLGNAQAVRALGVEKWRSLAGTYGPLLSDEERAQWLQGLTSAFVNDAQAFTALSRDAFGALVSALRTLGREDVGPLYVAYVIGSENWKAADADGLYGLAQILAKTEQAGAAARARVVGHIASVLADPEQASALPLGKLKLMSRVLVGDTSSETRAACANGLRAVFAADQQTLANLDCDGYGDLVTILGWLADPNTGTLTASWMAASDAWKALGRSGLYGLGKRLGTLGQDGEAVRSQLAERVVAKLRADPVAARAEGCRAWTMFYRVFPKDAVPSEKRDALAVALRAVFADNPATLANMRAGDFQQLVSVLKVLGDTKTGELSTQWMEASDAWKSGNLLWFLRALPEAGEAALDARRSLVVQVEEQHLADVDAIRAVGVSTWRAIVFEVRRVLTPAAKRQWADALRPALLQDGSDGALSTEDFVAVTQILRSLDDDGVAAPVKTWLADNEDRLSEITAGDVAALVSTAAKGGLEGIVPLMQQIDTTWQAKLAAGDATPADCRYLSRAWRAAGDLERGGQWARHMYNLVLGSEAARGEADVPTLNFLVGTMHHMRMLHHTQEYPAFTQVAARLAREGKLDDLRGQRRRHWGMLLKMPESRATLEAELVDAEGNPRLVVAKVLSYAYERTESTLAWRTFLDEQVAATTGDTKVLWMLARAYAEMAKLEGIMKPWCGKKEWLDPALAAAESSAVRLRVILEYVERYRIARRPAAGIQFLESVREQFSGVQSVQLQDVASKLAAEQAQLDARGARYLATQEISHKEGLLAYYRHRLGVYEAAGDRTGDVGKLRAEIQLLEQELRE